MNVSTPSNEQMQQVMQQTQEYITDLYSNDNSSISMSTDLYPHLNPMNAFDESLSYSTARTYATQLVEAFNTNFGPNWAHNPEAIRKYRQLLEKSVDAHQPEELVGLIFP